MRAAVITGVSSGIGWGTAKVLIRQGCHVFGSVRKEADAARLAQEFGDAAFTPLLFDVTDEAAVQAAAAQVRVRVAGETLFGLVNNAGISVPGPLLLQPLDDFRRQIEVNLTGQLIVTQAFAPLLGADTTLRGAPGRIVNISSVGGKMGWPFGGAYVASKHGLEGLSESLRQELMLYGIDVIVVGPGAIATRIWDKVEQFDISRYLTSDYGPSLRRFADRILPEGRKGLPPEEVGEVVWKALTARHPRLRYAVLPGGVLRGSVPAFVPRRLVDRVIARMFGLEPNRR